MGSGHFARSILLAAVAVSLTLPAAAPAALDIHHDSTTVSEVPSGDGIISQGDALDVTETVRSSEPGSDLTGLSGLLSTSTPGVSIPQASSAFPSLGFGGTAANSTPYRVQVGAGVDCGQNLRFSLGLSADQGTATVPFVIGTGTAGPPVDSSSADVPRAIPDTSVATSSLPISSSARVKDIAVHIGKISHTYDGDLKITLIAPDGTSVVLVDQRGGSGADFVNTTFTVDQGAPVAGASAPFTGTYTAEGDLGNMIGHPEQGTWKLQVNDQAPGNTGTIISWGLTLSDATCVAQPVASFTATPNPVAPGDPVQLDASGSHDPVGTITKYEWDLDGDGTFETDGASTPTTSETFATRGAYVVGLRVTDDHGLVSTYQRTINVSLPPTAALTSSSPGPLTFETFTLDASGSTDPDGAPIARYEFDLDGDGIYEVNSGSVSHVSTSFSTPGTHTVGVRVTDEDGATDTAILDVTVLNRPPTAQLVDPGIGVVGRALTMSAAGSSDPDGTIDVYEWDLDGDGAYDDASTAVPTAPPYTYTSSGTVTVGLRVTDSDGAQATTSVTFKVTDPPLAALTATPLPARPKQVVSFSAAGSSDPDGTTLTYRWDLDGDGTFELDTGSVATASKAYPLVGSYPVKVEVTDSDGVKTVATKTVDVVNLLPSPSLVVSSGDAVTGAPVTFDASGSSDPDGTIAKYQWDLDGNGSYETDTGTVPTASRTYPNAGTISVRLRVTDNDGATATTTTPVVVRAPAAGGATTAGTGGTSGTGGSGGSGGGSGGTVVPGSEPLGDFSAGLGGAPIQALRLAVRKGVSMTCTSDRAMRCNVTATVDFRTARKLRLARTRKAAKVGSAVVDVVARGDGRFMLKLTKKARRQLKRAKRVRLLVKGTAVDADGHVVTLARVVLLRR